MVGGRASRHQANGTGNRGALPGPSLARSLLVSPVVRLASRAFLQTAAGAPPRLASRRGLATGNHTRRRRARPPPPQLITDGLGTTRPFPYSLHTPPSSTAPPCRIVGSCGASRAFPHLMHPVLSDLDLCYPAGSSLPVSTRLIYRLRPCYWLQYLASPSGQGSTSLRLSSQPLLCDTRSLEVCAETPPQDTSQPHLIMMIPVDGMCAGDPPRDAPTPTTPLDQKACMLHSAPHMQAPSEEWANNEQAEMEINQANVVGPCVNTLGGS